MITYGKTDNNLLYLGGSRDAEQEEKEENIFPTPRLMRINIMESITGDHPEFKVLFLILD